MEVEMYFLCICTTLVVLMLFFKRSYTLVYIAALVRCTVLLCVQYNVKLCFQTCLLNRLMWLKTYHIAYHAAATPVVSMFFPTRNVQKERYK